MKATLTQWRDHGDRMPRVVHAAEATPSPKLPPEFSPEAAWQFYLRNLAVAQTIDMIARRVAEVTPVILSEGSSFDVAPIRDIVMFPGLNRSRTQLVREVATRMMVTGTAFVILTGRHDRPPLAIDVLDTLRVTASPGADGWPINYKVSPDPGWVFNRVVLTRSNLGFVNSAVGELLPIYEVSGSANGVGLSRLRAMWSVLTQTIRADDVGLISLMRYRFEVPDAYAAGAATKAATAAGVALHQDVILPLFSVIYGTLARTFSERWSVDLRIVPGTDSARGAYPL